MKGWVLVTGGAKRVGREIALELARQGWDIALHYYKSADDARRTAQDIHDLGVNVCLAEIDLADPKNAANLIPSLAGEIGMIDALVNNAALFEPDSGDSDGTRHMAINADAPRLLSKAFRDHLPPDEKGCIVNILDALPAPENFSAYGKSKNFLCDLTRNMAKSFAPQVRVNGVAPMYVLPGARQSEQAFLKLAGDRLTPPAQVALAVRQLIETPAATGQIVQVRPK
jgi:NAD(P)-dependent dehydrogenase (short-subunit alcohol dehydrogenase family)